MPVFKPIIQPFFLFPCHQFWHLYLCLQFTQKLSFFVEKSWKLKTALFSSRSRNEKSFLCLAESNFLAFLVQNITYYKINNEHSLLCQIHFWTILFHFLVVKKGKVWVNKCEYAWGRKIDTFFSPEWVNRLFAEWLDLK